MHRYWPRLWAENPTLLAEARKQEYLVHEYKDGSLACKACGTYVPWEPIRDHFAKHMAELDAYLAKQRAEKREPEAEGTYPNPCATCGELIPRTGKPGRPPLLCDRCAFPAAHPVAVESLLDEDDFAILREEAADTAYTPEEKAILEELGLE